MLCIIFDVDGVLIDTMSFHAEAIRIAIKEETNLDIDKKIIYLLEGMPSAELIKEVFKRKGYHNTEGVYDNSELVEKIGKKKKEIFKSIIESKPFDGVKELINDLSKSKCLKALVTGAADQELELILNKSNIAKKNFDVIITGDDLEEGKPDTTPFQAAL